jgi:hypothetical protein
MGSELRRRRPAIAAPRGTAAPTLADEAAEVAATRAGDRQRGGGGDGAAEPNRTDRFCKP